MGTALGVLLSGVSGAAVPQWLASRIRDGLAGVILFAENTPDPAATRALTDELRSHRADLVIAVDEEGGDVTRLQARTGSSFPTPAALGAVDDPELTRRCAELLGRLVAEAGIDLDLAPMLDVASEPENPVIGVRSFGADPDLVSRHGRAYAEGLAAAGVASCGKHYPGHGDTRSDSHAGDAVVDVPAEVLARRDEAPFAAAGVDSVMTAHVVVPALGPEPASISAWSTERLRAAGFTGAIITDALGMRAISDRMPLGEACVRALEAGADLLCLDAPQHREPEQALLEAEAAIEAAVASGRLSAEALRESAARNRRLHRREGGFDKLSQPEGGFDKLSQHKLSQRLGLEVARRAIVTRGAPRLSGDPVVIDLRRRYNLAAGDTGAVLVGALRERWPGLSLHDDPAYADPNRSLLVIWPGAEAADVAALQQLRERHPDPVVLHTGVAAAAPEGVRLVCSHGSAPPNVLAAIEVLADQPALTSTPTEERP
ncbi:beta-glucosidase [Enemella dayhoffiae]|uniref:Beta-glucosidase n=1 Tax=Enemella dayhoffiae TaxID=2016507 RepID=A0A255GSA1_9ACTN|nr:glycoside hydrolase family 3 N-terminal domain-containing protein [Enemella dayhoffiae]OYO18715.1 beta-glucosidase [Enemella dayhoffiae]